MTARLGRGRTVETFAGTLDDGTKTDVAIKRVRPELADNKTFVDAFLSWGRSQRDLEHRNVVTVLEAGVEGDRPFVLQERVFGASLGTILGELRSTGRTLRPALIFDIIRRATDGLAYVQRTLGEPHAGLDPYEVLIGYHGEVKLGDQRLHALDRLVPEAHHSGSIYLAADVREGRRQADQSGDVHSMALIMLELLIGQAVWAAESMSVEASILALRDFAHMGSAYPDLTEGLVALLGRCVSSDAAERIESAADLKEALASLAAKNDLVPDPEGLGAFLRTLLPRQRADEAPTMLVSTHTEDKVDRFSAPEFTENSVLVDPNVVAKARERALQISATGPGGSGASSRRAPSDGGGPGQPRILNPGRPGPKAASRRGGAKRGSPSPVVRPREHPQSAGRDAQDPLEALPGGKRTAWVLLGLGAVAVVVLFVMVVRGA